MIAYKLFRVRKNGTLGPLFIGRSIQVPIGVRLDAQPIRTKGFAFRPGWHACWKPFAPHLSKQGRVWCRVSIKGVQRHVRPEAQGGLWYTARSLKVIEVLGA